MAMVFLVGPCCLCAGQTVTIHENKACGPVCKSAKRFQSWNKKRRGNIPLNLFKGDIIETCQHLRFHLPKSPCPASNAKLILHHTPVLLNEVELAVILWIVVT